jgi:hypothetical protein
MEFNPEQSLEYWISLLCKENPEEALQIIERID